MHLLSPPIHFQMLPNDDVLILHLRYIIYFAFFRLAREDSFDFVLKTDDDCFVDIEKIYADLGKVRGKSKVWWSR